MPDFSLLKQSLLACSANVMQRIEDLLSCNGNDSPILNSMRYSALSIGKRIRPFLLIATANVFAIPTSKCLNIAVAIEFIHTYSLIHDDLPAMDNDDFRRGKPTNHKQFGEAMAILAGDALLTYAFELLSLPESHSDAHIRCELIKIIAKASGFLGMVGGQAIDILSKHNSLTSEEIINMHRLKTGELFMASAECGAVIGRATNEERQAIRHYARDLGIAFQIQDDIIDYSGQSFGKVNLDETRHVTNNKGKDQINIVDKIGLEQAKQHLQALKHQAKQHLGIFGIKANLLNDLVDFVVMDDNH